MQYGLKQLEQIAHGLAMQFGSSCEVVIHDARTKGMEGTIVCIENGEISNRRVGDGPSHAVLEAIKSGDKELADRYGYLTRTKDGRVFRSSTIYIRDEDGNIHYVFCINSDITDVLNLQKAVAGITGSTGLTEGPAEKPDAERITTSVADLLDDLIAQAVALVGVPAGEMTKAQRCQAIKYLNDAGAFLISKAADKITDYFGISKFTLYSDLNSVKEKDAVL